MVKQYQQIVRERMVGIAHPTAGFPMPMFKLKPVVCSEDCQALRAAIGRRTVTLASNSPRRCQILAACGISFRQLEPGVAEAPPRGRDHRAWARRWAMRKAMSVAARRHSGFILAADTIVVRQGRGLGKPRDAAEANAMLAHLSGATHRVITGVAVVAPPIKDSHNGTGHGARRASGSAVSEVRFRRLSPEEIASYVAGGEPFGKAGGYAIQGEAGRFVTSIRGPVDNVVGLPVRRLAQIAGRVINEHAAG